MNSIKIEKGAVEAIKKTIRLHDKMDELLQENDKGPSWDGDIYLYNNIDLKAEHIQYRIPTQIKGKNNNQLLHRKSITYPVEYKNLRNYFNDGGVCYFVIVVSDDGEKASIFYNALTPIKLQAILKGNEQKQPDQTKNIALSKLKNNDKNILYNILLQFGHDSKAQGTGELVRKAIPFNDLKNIDSIKMTAYTSNHEEVLKNIQKGEVCLFGHQSSLDIWLPFSYDTQKNMEISTTTRMHESFGVDGVPYYKYYDLIKKANNIFHIRLSENLELCISENNIYFSLKSDVQTVVKDIHFLEALQHGTGLYVGNKKVIEYTSPKKFDHKIQKAINDFKLIQLALSKFGLTIDKRLADFEDKDWDAINELATLYKRKMVPKSDVSFHMWWWQGKVVPFILIKDDTQQVQIENMFHSQQLKVHFEVEEKEYQFPIYINMQRDVWENLYDVPEEFLLDDLEGYEYNHDTEGIFALLFVELLSAYDHTGNEKYYNMSRLISEKLLGVSPMNEYWRINKLQLLRRRRALAEFEMQELENLEMESKDSKVICAVNILLENKRKAQKILDAMNEEDRKLFITYPIYNLLVR